MKSHILKSAALAAVCTVSVAANANLLENGSFENPDIATGSWSYFTSTDVPGWSGSNIEIWDHLSGEPAYDGEQFAELNAHPGTGSAFTIFQDFTTIVGQEYNYSFAYQARSSDSEAFDAIIDSIAGGIDGITRLATNRMDDHDTTGWSVFSSSFVATETTSRIAFSTVIPQTGTVGNFLDDVRVEAVSVSEPGSLALLGLGLAGLGLTRRRASK